MLNALPEGLEGVVGSVWEGLLAKVALVRLTKVSVVRIM